MEKIQILFPEPCMRRLRDLARREDRPVSEIVRRATEAWLDRYPASDARDGRLTVPVFHGGAIRISAERMRDAAWLDRTLSVVEGASEGAGDEQP
jgi:hypothetical protein